MKTRTLCAALVMLCLLAGSALAQGEPSKPALPNAKPGLGPRAGGDDQNINELIEVVIAARLAKQLGLNDEQTVVMLRRFSEFREKLNALRKERQEILKALKADLRAGKPDAEIETKLKELEAHDTKMAEFKKSVYEQASTGLTVSQRAKLYVFLNEFENDMRKLVQEARARNAHRWGAADNPPPQPGTPEGRPHRPAQRPGARLPRPPANPAPAENEAPPK